MPQLNEELKLSYSQTFDLVQFLVKDFSDWNIFKLGYIDEEGNITKEGKGKLSWAELVVRNIKKMLIKHTIIKGTWGQAIFDKRIYRFIDLLKETKKQIPEIDSEIMNDEAILRNALKLDKIINEVNKKK